MGLWSRSEEDCVWEHTMTTSDKDHGPLAPAPQGWPQAPHLRRRISSMGTRTRFSPLAPCSWCVCGQSILICRRDKALGRLLLVIFLARQILLPSRCPCILIDLGGILLASRLCLDVGAAPRRSVWFAKFSVQLFQHRDTPATARTGRKAIGYLRRISGLFHLAEGFNLLQAYFKAKANCIIRLERHKLPLSSVESIGIKASTRF